MTTYFSCKALGFAEHFMRESLAIVTSREVDDRRVLPWLHLQLDLDAEADNVQEQLRLVLLVKMRKKKSVFIPYAVAN